MSIRGNRKDLDLKAKRTGDNSPRIMRLLLGEMRNCIKNNALHASRQGDGWREADLGV